MTVIEVLRDAGLEIRGDPARGVIQVGGGTVEVSLAETAGGLVIDASVEHSSRPPEDGLSEAAMDAPGDSSFSWSGGQLRATRSLVEPDAGRAYDAVWDLAKLCRALSLFLLEYERLRKEGAGVDPGPRAAVPAPEQAAAIQSAPAVVAPPQSSLGAAQPTPSAAPTGRAAPTHLTPPAGIQAWSAPSPQAQPVTVLVGSVPVTVLVTQADGWCQIELDNGWTTWVDGRHLVPR